MPGHDIIAIGASAGGVEALTKIATALPEDLPASVLVTLHLPQGSTSVLPTILNRSGPLPASHPTDGEPLLPGRIYVAPGDRHLLVEDGHIALSYGPKENGSRPAADPLFRTAARAYGPRMVGVVLTGSLDDGTAGLAMVKQLGGVAVVQDPGDALFPEMPRSAIENVAVDHVLPLDEIAPKLVELAKRPVKEPAMAGTDDAPNQPPPLEDQGIPAREEEVEYVPSAFVCPDCGGTLWEVPEGDVLRFRCRVGHAFSADSLMEQQTAALESAMWAALRSLEENADLSDRLAERMRARGHERSAAQFKNRAADARQRASLVRDVLSHGWAPPPTSREEDDERAG